MYKALPSGYLTVRHGKSPFMTGKPSTVFLLAIYFPWQTVNVIPRWVIFNPWFSITTQRRLVDPLRFLIQGLEDAGVRGDVGPLAQSVEVLHLPVVPEKNPHNPWSRYVEIHGNSLKPWFRLGCDWILGRRGSIVRIVTVTIDMLLLI